MLKSTHRLSTKQFMDVMKSGRIYTSPLFGARIVFGSSQTGKSLIISAVAPKKVASTAVLRSKTRRRIYKAVIHSNIYATYTKSAQIIICAKNEMIPTTQEMVDADMVLLFKKIGLSV